MQTNRKVESAERKNLLKEKTNELNGKKETKTLYTDKASNKKV
jgi:hypothetical protein